MVPAQADQEEERTKKRHIVPGLLSHSTIIAWLTLFVTLIGVWSNLWIQIGDRKWAAISGACALGVLVLAAVAALIYLAVPRKA